MLKKLVFAVGTLALAGAIGYGSVQAYYGIQWIRGAHARSHQLYQYLLTPVGKTSDGKIVLRGDILEVLIQQELTKLKGA